MKTVKALLISISFMLIIACSDFNNPISSDIEGQDSSQDDLILYNTSGTSEQG